MTRPNFLVIGPHKAGTTSLQQYLQQHPDVFLPALKEARYFSYNPGKPPAPSSPYVWPETRHPIRSWEQYQELFAPATTHKAIGEISPCYLNDPYAPGRVRTVLPEVRLIASLRDPVDRAYSDYLMAVRNGRETRAFMDILRARSDWYGTLAYYEPCRRWLACFPRDRLMLIRTETLRDRPKAVVDAIFAFLEVSPGIDVDTSEQFHASGVPRSRGLDRLFSGSYVQALRPYVPRSLRGILRPLKKANLRSAPQLTSVHRAEVVAMLRDDILRLQDLVDMDLSDWLDAERPPVQGQPAGSLRHGITPGRSTGC